MTSWSACRSSVVRPVLEERSITAHTIHIDFYGARRARDARRRRPHCCRTLHGALRFVLQVTLTEGDMRLVLRSMLVSAALSRSVCGCRVMGHGVPPPPPAPQTPGAAATSIE